MNIDMVKKSWRARGFGCDVWHDSAGQVWENFTHDTDELLMVLEGKVEIEIEGKVQRPKIGEEVLIPKQALHSVRNRGKTPSRWLYGYKRTGF